MSREDQVLEQLQKSNDRLAEISDRLAAQIDLVLTRDQAANQLKISVRQLQRLAASGRIALHSSGVARAELERYATSLMLDATPAPKLLTHPQAMRANKLEAERARAAKKVPR